MYTIKPPIQFSATTDKKSNNLVCKSQISSLLKSKYGSRLQPVAYMTPCLSTSVHPQNRQTACHSTRSAVSLRCLPSRYTESLSIRGGEKKVSSFLLPMFELHFAKRDVEFWCLQGTYPENRLESEGKVIFYDVNELLKYLTCLLYIFYEKSKKTNQTHKFSKQSTCN